jgi:DNA-directed RNA polymerase specialized sigma24 family protein
MSINQLNSTIEKGTRVPEIDWEDLYEKIKTNTSREECEEKLYQYIKSKYKIALEKELGTNACEDLLHEIFLQAIQALRNGVISNPNAIISYINSIVSGKKIGVIRKLCLNRKFFTPTDDNNINHINGAHAEQETNSRLDRKRLLEIIEKKLNNIERLSSEDKRIIFAFYFEEKTQEEIMEELKIKKVDEFKNRKHRALQKLKSVKPLLK